MKGMAYRWFRLKRLLTHCSHMIYHWLFNRTFRQQRKHYKNIPIIIISYNQLYYLKKLVEFLLEKGYRHLVILDNNSNYPPLLDYLAAIESRVTVIRLDENKGHLAFWKTAEVYKSYSKGYYVLTDPDVVPVDNCPENFLLTFRRLLDKAFDRTKVGFSLKLDDIPYTNPNKDHIERWESKFWSTKIHPLAFKAEIDTTFALYRPRYRYRLKHFTKAWRTSYPLQARHGGWYFDVKNLTNEQTYYMKTANDSASWHIDAQGKLINVKHKSLYSNDA